VSISKSEAFRASLLNRLPAASHYCIAYSGGVDSHVLLHAMAACADRLPAAIAAVHVDHQLLQQSADWVLHCRAVCAELGVPFEALRVDAAPASGESPEAAARRARYQALADWLPGEAVLLTAQHREDQAETLLLQLLRGAGPRGLAAMPQVAPFGPGRLARPLLELSRAAILAYARRERLRWVEDPSNDDLRYDRNLLRRRLMPAIRQRWQGVDKVLARAAVLQADQAELAGALADIDARPCRVSDRLDQLACAPLQAMSRARQRNLLRAWVADNGLPIPAQVVLDQIVDSVLAARPDASPCLQWSGAEVRRYRDRLYVMPPLPPDDSQARFTWNINEPLHLPDGSTLTAVAAGGGGLRVSDDARLEIRYRQGGEALQPAGRQGHHALKKLFQEWGVPDWQRSRVPLVFNQGMLVAVAGFCVCEGFQTCSAEPGYALRWNGSMNSARIAL
jgi:tRNA(Ile)-lysidine synthase